MNIWKLSHRDQYSQRRRLKWFALKREAMDRQWELKQTGGADPIHLKQIVIENTRGGIVRFLNKNLTRDER